MRETSTSRHQVKIPTHAREHTTTQQANGNLIFTNEKCSHSVKLQEKKHKLSKYCLHKIFPNFHNMKARKQLNVLYLSRSMHGRKFFKFQRMLDAACYPQFLLTFFILFNFIVCSYLYEQMLSSFIFSVIYLDNNFYKKNYYPDEVSGVL